MIRKWLLVFLVFMLFLSSCTDTVNSTTGADAIKQTPQPPATLGSPLGNFKNKFGEFDQWVEGSEYRHSNASLFSSDIKTYYITVQNGLVDEILVDDISEAEDPNGNYCSSFFPPDSQMIESTEDQDQAGKEVVY